MVVGLKLPVQSVPIIIKVVSSNPVHDQVNKMQYYVIKFLSDLTDPWFSQGTSVSSTNKTDRHDNVEILLKVALNTIPSQPRYVNLLSTRAAIIPRIILNFFNSVFKRI